MLENDEFDEFDDVYRASCDGDFKTVKDLLENTKDKKEFLDTSLIWSSAYGHLEIVKFLFENGAISSHGSMWWAASRGHLEVVRFLLKNGENIVEHLESALVCASACGHLEVVKFLVETGADIRLGIDGAAWWASENGHLDIVKYLESLDL